MGVNKGEALKLGKQALLFVEEDRARLTALIHHLVVTGEQFEMEASFLPRGEVRIFTCAAAR